MLRLSLAAAAALLTVLPLTAQLPDAGGPAGRAFEAWRLRHGSEWILRTDSATGAAQLLYGGTRPALFLPARDTEWFELARIVLDEVHGMFGLDEASLVPEDVLQLELSQIGSSDKVAVRFRQAVGGVPVVRGSVTVLFAADAGMLAVDTTGLPRLGGFRTVPASGRFAAVAAGRAAYLQLEAREPVDIEAPELVIYPLASGSAITPRLAWAVEMNTPLEEGYPTGRRLYLAADRAASELLGSDQLVHQLQDVIGHVDARATPGVRPDIAANPPAAQAMRFMDVTSPAGNARTDANGDFLIPGAGAGPVDVTATFNGPWARVSNWMAANYSLTQSFTPGTPGTMLMNPGPTAGATAQADAYDSVIDFREYIKSVAPGDTTMDFPVAAITNFFIPCNAVFTGSNIVFFKSGSGCVNTSYSTVVAHEEGHWANVEYGSGNGPDGFGEGNADVWAMYIYDTPVVGEEFFGQGGGFIRTGNNTRQFCGNANPGCYGEVHDDGEVIMGALWKVRRNLNTTLGNAAGDLVADTLFMAWMNTFDDGQIRTIIEDHWLVLDDDDGNLQNGTPNFADIDGGFREQGFPGVSINKDTIALTGPASANPGDTLAFSYAAAPAGSGTWLAWSLSVNGSVIAGHAFDLGLPVSVAATGTADPSGAGSWSVGPVPPGASGLTVHFEVAAQSGPDLFDSNVVSVLVN